MRRARVPISARLQMHEALPGKDIAALDWVGHRKSQTD